MKQLQPRRNLCIGIMHHDREPSKTGRRTLLKALGIGTAGTVGAGLISNRTSAAARTFGNLTVNVEPGWKQLGGGWKPLEGDHIDLKTAFDARIDVSPVSTSEEINLAYLVAAAGPEGSYASVQHGTMEGNAPSSSIWFVHGNEVTRAFRPDKGVTSWPQGMYQLFASVIDRDNIESGAAVSQTFEIS